MQILYKGKSSTYVGECECGTIVLAKESEVKLKCYNQTHTYFSAKCPECGEGIIVYKDGCERANGIRAKALLNQKEANQEANRRGAAAFLAGLEEIQEKDLKTKFDQLKQILEDYAAKENYWTESDDCSYDCTCCDYKEAERGLLLLEELKIT